MVNIFFPFRGYNVHHVFTRIPFFPIRASLTISSATSVGVLSPVTSIKKVQSGIGTISFMKSNVSCSMLSLLILLRYDRLRVSRRTAFLLSQIENYYLRSVERWECL